MSRPRVNTLLLSEETYKLNLLQKDFLRRPKGVVFLIANRHVFPRSRENYYRISFNIILIGASGLLTHPWGNEEFLYSRRGRGLLSPPQRELR